MVGPMSGPMSDLYEVVYTSHSGAIIFLNGVKQPDPVVRALARMCAASDLVSARSLRPLLPDNF